MSCDTTRPAGDILPPASPSTLAAASATRQCTSTARRYKFNTGGSVGGGVVTYEVDGKQYVATTSGVVSGFFGGNGTSAIIIFALH